MAKLTSNTENIETINGKVYRTIPITEMYRNGFFIVDKHWTVKYWNKAAEKLLGVRASDITGKNLWEKFAGVTPLDFHALYDKAFLQDTPAHFEEYWGDMGAWVDVITYHCDDTLSVSFKSNDHRVDPANHFKVLNEMYKFVTEVTHDCLWEWSLQSEEIFWIDAGHKRVFGYPIENALIPQVFWENNLHPDDKSRVLKKLNKIIREGPGSIWEEEYRFKRSGGEYAYVHDRGHIIYEADTAVRIIGATRDITDRKMTEIKLLQNEKKLSLIAKQTENVVIITGADEKITWVNSAFTGLTGYKAEEVIGKKPGSLLQGKDTDPITVDYLRRQIRNKQPFDCNILNYSKSGRQYWMHMLGQPMLDEDGNCECFFSIETDITEKVLAEKKVVQDILVRQKEIMDAVLTAQENEREDIGKELHDNMNQILVAAKLYIEMAKIDTTDRQMFLDKASGYIVDVIEEIRKISKALVPPALDIIGFFNSIKILLDDLSLVHPVKMEFHTHGITEEELGKKLQMNIFRIIQAQVNNILTHAKATHATIHLSRYEKEIRLFISDNGIGFDIRQRRKGVGIRNIISRAEICHGQAEIKSKPGEGFQLSIVLPYGEILQ